MIRKPRLGPLAAFVLALATSASGERGWADFDVIIPRPKAIEEVSSPVPLEGFRLVVDSDPKARIGAEEINRRIVSLGGAPLETVDLHAELPDGKLIVIAAASETPPIGALRRESDLDGLGAQGYVIRPVGEGDNLRLFLMGSDSLGALYAAVTCRQLIVQRDGKLLLQPVKAHDWPDYKVRLVGTPFSEVYRGNWYGVLSAERRGDLPEARRLARDWVAVEKRYFDWMLRAKMNMAWMGTNVRPGDAPDSTTVARAALREVHEYGLARGIESMCGDTTAIGTYPKDKDNPDFADVVYHRSHHRYFCWSRLDYHRRRAERAAKFLSDSGYTGYYLHATDGGGWQNPALWNDRCPLCRETYGDDHAKADAVVFKVYYDAIKRRIPHVKFAAVVYPYTGKHLDPDAVYQSAAAMMGEGPSARELADQTSRKLTDFLKRLNTLLPEDMYVCIRESERGPLDRIRRAWGERRFHMYFEYAFWKGWRPYFVTTPLWTKGLHYPEYDDILFGSFGGSWREVTQLLAAECAWNVSRPGARDFDDSAWHGIGTRLAPPPERQSFALRACRFMFGNDAGPLIAPAFAESISRYYICFPDQVLERLHLDDPAQTMAEQAEATARAAASLDQLWDLQERSKVLTPDARGYFLNTYLMTHAARVLATHRARILAVQTAIRQGKTAEVEKQLRAAAVELRRAETEWPAIRDKVPRDQCLTWPTRKTSVAGLLTQLDVAELKEEASDLWKRRHELIAEHTIPDWFEKTCRNSTVSAVPAGRAIVVDGRLDEPVWVQTPRIEHFIDHRMLRLASLETVARAAYDDKTLYLSFECIDPDPAGITAVMSGRDQLGRCDSVEVLAASNSESKEFVHWIIDSKGAVFDARSTKGPGGTKYSGEWNGSAQVKVVHAADRWTVEIAIPATDLPFVLAPGRNASILLCRNIVHTRRQGDEEAVANVYLDGSGFRTVERFAGLRLQRQAPAPTPPQISLRLRPMRFAHETTGSGSGTRIGGGLRIETDRTLHDVQVTIQCTDGVEPIGSKQFDPAGPVQLVWQPEEPFAMHLPIEVPGVECTFAVTSREGRWSFVRRFGSPRRPDVSPDELYAPGIDDRALAKPAFFSSFKPDTIQMPEGTIEFWIKPRRELISRRPGPRGTLEQTFFNMGPIRPEHPYLSNYSSLTISLSCYGDLHGTISNEHYESRSVGTRLRDWVKGRWHHVALAWKLDDGGKTSMALYIDGELASDRCMGSAKHPNTTPLEVKQPKLPIQVGAMNTGYRPTDADIDELRISSVRRYSAAFEPEKRFSPDGFTQALFHFDGSLTSEVPADCTAIAGPAQSAP